MIGPEKKFFDTAKRSLDRVKLTREWKQFEISIGDLQSNESLTCIKTGFIWSVASSGQPVVFHLDNIRFE